MYLIIRCPGCQAFSYADRYQKYKLCPDCGYTMNIKSCPVYLDVKTFPQAEAIVKELEAYLHKRNKKELTPDEILTLREDYTEWIRSNPP
ncbi:DUF1922 domain-containing protein [Methanoplanus limicola]|uniref:DUF1922 domain-containing protein n=1 Tax=Methanoplanus limicola DSM 2279 TaxID=937775 RepID=H1Z128_9EURY|nr:DUF1922 domain-containing protein [Methanoplanus limicola]EHQ34504.1 hypothetical protein Metlim_0363 [Methanoplanus limicola DSM 2279]